MSRLPLWISGMLVASACSSNQIPTDPLKDPPSLPTMDIGTDAPSMARGPAIYRLTGNAVGESNWEFTIAAILIPGDPAPAGGSVQLHGPGRISGIILDTPLVRGGVVEVVPPEGEYPYWCIAMQADSPAEILGLNVLVYVKNIGDGKATFDEVSIGGGPGYTCASNRVPDGEFVPAVKGDFKESVSP